ncbi:MAG: DUF401 family protein [Thermodesulfovibrionales bacterium]|nr:DUF401 family protein [Thermodesulfovibrionales bacterium]
MSDISRVLLIFITILILIRFKWNVGYVLIIASGLLALLYRMPIEAIFFTITSTLTDPITIKLFFSLTLIRVFEIILREKRVLARMAQFLRSFLKKRKVVIVSMPMFIGLLPSLGGAYFSAPMVAESTADIEMSQEEKGFINYWFRHPWEFILPLYPGILLTAVVSQVELRSIILINSIYAFLMVLMGFIFSMRGIKGDGVPIIKRDDCQLINFGVQDKTSFLSFIPLILIFLLVVFFGLDLSHALAITIVSLLLFYRIYRIEELLRVFKYGFTLEVVVLIFGIMLFKMTLDSSGAVQGLSLFFSESGIPMILILVILPFVTGLLTGITVGFVGTTFPLLLSIMGFSDLKAISLAFASGYVGVLLSPVHLCLLLTRQYFQADIKGIYGKLIPCCLLILLAALMVYYLS